jgi:hypothetical protein
MSNFFIAFLNWLLPFDGAVSDTGINGNASRTHFSGLLVIRKETSSI